MKKKIRIIILIIIVWLWVFCYIHNKNNWEIRMWEEKGEYINWVKEWLRTAHYSNKQIYRQWNYINWLKEWEWNTYYYDWELWETANYEHWVLSWVRIRYERGIYEDDDKYTNTLNYVWWKETWTWIIEFTQSKYWISKRETVYSNWVSQKVIIHYNDWRVEEVDSK